MLDDLEAAVSPQATLSLTGVIDNSSGKSLLKTGLGVLNMNRLAGFAPGAVLAVREGTLNLSGSPSGEEQSEIIIENDAAFNILGGQYTLDAIGGNGMTQVTGDARLTALSIAQNTLSIGGVLISNAIPIGGDPRIGNDPASVPEPTVLSLLIAGVVSLPAVGRKYVRRS